MPDDSLTLADPTNRQRHPRLSVLIGAALIVEGHQVDCDVIDLSAGGAKVRVDHSLDIGMLVDLSIEGSPQLGGTVVWWNGEFAGIRFHENAELAEDEVVEVIESAQDDRERRTDTRTSVLWLADLYVGIRHYRCKILNIAAGGAKLSIDADLKLGAEVTLRSRNFGEFKAEIVWKKDGAFGVRFEGTYEGRKNRES